jgi:hypothetical protein
MGEKQFFTAKSPGVSCFTPHTTGEKKTSGFIISLRKKEKINKRSRSSFFFFRRKRGSTSGNQPAERIKNTLSRPFVKGKKGVPFFLLQKNRI